MSTRIYAGLSIVLFSIWYAQSREKKRLQLPHPPGPKPRFLVGNVPDFPYESPWLVYNEWKKQYGDVVYLDLMGQPMVILNSRDACIDLLEKRSSIYSDRPRLVMLNELMGWDYDFALMHYSDRWRVHRRMFHQYMNEHAAQEYRPLQERHTHTLLRNFLQTPDKFLDHIRLSFASSIMDVLYGIKVDNFDDIYVKTAEAALHGLAVAGNPGSFMVDTMPWLKYIPSWFPGAGFQKKAAEWKKPTVAMTVLPYEHVKRDMEAGKAGPSIIASMLSRCDEDRTEIEKGVVIEESVEDIARCATAVAYVGGSDTTLSSIQSFLLAMAKWPEVLKAAQAEIDAVVGADRLPTFDDRDSLPYVEAVMKETLRWLTVLPVGLAHASIEDDEYKGYLIPKGSIVIANAWSILHDPEVYPDPETFKPERFLIKTSEGWKVNPNIPDPDAAFGFGRRICAGRYFADNSLFIIVANILSVFNVAAPLDASGKPVHLEAKATSGMLSYPAPYKVTITPRSDKAARLIRDSELL